MTTCQFRISLNPINLPEENGPNFGLNRSPGLRFHFGIQSREVIRITEVKKSNSNGKKSGPEKNFGLDRTSDYRGFGLDRFYCI